MLTVDERSGEELSGVALERSMAALVADPDFVRLSYELTQPSFLGVLGRSFTERWHSAFVAWLLDPKGDHGLGTKALRQLLADLSKASSGLVSTLDTTEALCSDLLEVTADVEYAVVVEGRRSPLRLDVFLSGKMVADDGSASDLRLIIENKVRARERKDQTSDYAAWADRLNAQRATETPLVDIRLLLAPVREGDPPMQPQHRSFAPYSYQQLYDRVLLPCLKDPALTTFGKMLLEQYERNLRTPVHQGERSFPMAKVRSDAEIIEQIVRKHFEVLNTIMLHFRGEELPETAKGREARVVAGELGDLVERGLLAPGSRLGIRGRDLNKDATVEVRDGVVGIVLDGQFYTSPSGAAAAAAGGSRNGWVSWRILHEDGSPGEQLGELRRRITNDSE
jgi:hypothetical protein